MTTNEQTIHRFYSAFQKMDYATMQSCYHPEAIFNDPVFGLLSATETKAMWKMLCLRAKDLTLTYGNIKLLDEEYTTCEWIASYIFTTTGRKVRNKITAHMRMKDGLIIEHTDAFDFYRWSRQAFGIIPGWAFGWSVYILRRVQKKARLGLEKFMQNES